MQALFLELVRLSLTGSVFALAVMASIGGMWTLSIGVALLILHLARQKSLGVGYIRIFEPGLLRKRLAVNKSRDTVLRPGDRRNQK